ncbi:MAG: hypothetical protein KJ630_00065 [Proteobacteria bacterium]|nr:hypothetical protein [Pseudomonadota bacterium]
MLEIKKVVPNSLKQNLVNAIGWKTNRKIVVIESDDWGSIRMPSLAVYHYLIEQGLDIGSYYNRLDSLETEKDISALFEILDAFRVKTGKTPVITGNFLVANPNFERIKSDHFQNYHYEPFIKTYQRYPGCEKSFQTLQEGVVARLFRPQFHGREHLNVPMWMEALQDGHHETILAFECNCWGYKRDYKDAGAVRFQSAFNCRHLKDDAYYKDVLIEGLQLFERIFGYRFRSFIAQNFVWNNSIEKILAELGVHIIQGNRNQSIPMNGNQCYRTKLHYTGQRNRLGQRYLVRNAFFEPSSNPSKDWISSCIKEINNAFLWKTPAIISAHRVNFIGSLVPENREHNLRLFSKLLYEIQKKWPMVEFVSSDSLFIKNMEIPC